MAVLPQVRVFREYAQTPNASVNPLNAYFVGQLADLIRFDVPGEQSRGRLGYYDPFVSQQFSYPEDPAGATVDQDYFKLFVKDALLRYYSESAGGASAFAVGSKQNKIVNTAISFEDNGDTYPHSSILGDRGAKVGDIVKVRAVPGSGDPVELWSYIKGFDYEETAPVVPATATAAAGNQPAIGGASVTVTKSAGPDNCVSLSVDESAYDGFETGGVEETYTLIVTGGSVGGDLTTAELRLVSASGKDDVASITAGADGVEFTVGSRNLALTFDVTIDVGCQADAAAAGVSEGDLVVGQQWTIEIEQVYPDPTVSVTGTYTGDKDTTYIIEVLRGVKLGASGDDPNDTDPPTVLSVSTTNGYDGGSTRVYLKDTEYSIGTKGLKIETDDNLYEGDRFLISVTAGVGGAKKTIILGHNLPDTIDAADPCDIDLFIRRQSLEVSYYRPDADPATNYEITENDITVDAGMTAFDSEWTVDGSMEPLPVISDEGQGYGELYAHYRLWLSDACGQVLSLSGPEDLDDVPGPLDPDNPLKYGLFIGTANNNGATIYYSGICDASDYDEWSNALDISLSRETIYGVVPLTEDHTVRQLFQAHVDAQSNPEIAVYRSTWLTLDARQTVPVLHAGTTIPGYEQPTSSDGEEVLATVSDNPDQTGTQYTRVVVPGGNGNFQAAGVRPKDTLRINFAVDIAGNPTYREFVVDEVINEDELILKSGLDAAEPVAIKIEIWRNLTADEEADAIATQGGAWSSEYVQVLWPDELESSGSILPGYFAAAAMCALSSGVSPHQGLTQIPINGFTSVKRTTDKFSREQLDRMSDAGITIITQNNQTGEIFARHALTTGDHTNVKKREEMVIRNVTSIARRFKLAYEPFIGVSNVTPEVLSLIRVTTKSLITELRTENVKSLLGAQLIDAEIVEIRQHALFEDRVVVVLRLTVPIPVNNIDLYLVI